MSQTETDVDACVWTSAHDDAFLVFLRESDVLWQFEFNLLEELLQRLHIFQEDELVFVFLRLEQIVIVNRLLMIHLFILLSSLLSELLILPELVGRHVPANLAEPFVRSERQEIVSADDGHFHLHRVGDRFGETLRRVCHLLEGKLQALAVAHVEVAAIMKPRQCVATVNFVELLLLLDVLFGRSA